MSVASTKAQAGVRRESDFEATQLVRLFVLRIGDFIELTKPKIAILALLTVCLGFAVATAHEASISGWWGRLGHAVFGIGLVAAASSGWNQWLERQIDARMLRTCRRPIPGGRITPQEAFWFSSVTSICGLVWLVCFVNSLTACLALITLTLYAFVYTPLKRVTVLNTVVGAIPGALPPVLGWTAGGAPLDLSSFALFAILFLWQFPHFMAIAWLYRQDYSDGGLRMLPVVDRSGSKTGLVAVGYALALLPVSWLPAQLGMAGDGYLGAASILGIWYVSSAAFFLASKSVPAAKRLLWTSLVYLPALLGVLVWDRFQLLL